MNTLISYTYRDASNYKSHNQAIVAGELSEADKQVILTCLDYETYFIPHLVGLGEKTFDDYDPNGQDDHPWFELGYYSFESTPAEPTVSVTASELVERFKACKDKWEELLDKESAPANTKVNRNLCPHCGAELVYDSQTRSGPTTLTAPWTCPSCKATGAAVFDMVTNRFQFHIERRPAKTEYIPTEKGTGRTRIVIVSPVWSMPEFRMSIEVPIDRDDEEFIDEYLDSLLAEDLRYNCEWEFAD